MKQRSQKIRIVYKNRKLEISYFFRKKRNAEKTVLYLHGMGCSKEDFAQAFAEKSFEKYSLIALDFPGSGKTLYPEDCKLTLKDLEKITQLFLKKIKAKAPFFIIGHSMGGVVGLLLAEKMKKKVLGFVSVEGNMMPQDCFWSRKIAQQSLDEPGAALAEFKRRTFLSRPNAQACFDYSRSLVEYSDHGRLLQRFLGLEAPKVFVFGSKNTKELSYLKKLEKGGSQTVKISKAGHFPFRDNGKEYYEKVGEFLDQN